MQFHAMQAVGVVMAPELDGGDDVCEGDHHHRLRGAPRTLRALLAGTGTGAPIRERAGEEPLRAEGTGGCDRVSGFPRKMTRRAFMMLNE